jgi:NADPH2:quinone reductase
MRAIQANQLGGPEVLELVQLPVPTLKAGQVLVGVRAVGLNFADILNVRGEYLTRPRLPMVPGMEFAGTVEALGEGVEGLQQGQLVAALGGSGAFAEYSVVSVRALLPVPANLSAYEAAALPVSYYTAYFSLRTLGRAEPGETVLVQAAAGALGTASVQMAKAMGLRVIALASSEEKLAMARSLGADIALLNSRDDLVDAVKQATNGRGVDVLMEVVGGPGFANSIKMLAYRGRLLNIGSASREAATLNPVALMKGNQSVIGVWLTPFVTDAKAMAEASEFIGPLIQSGKVKPVVGKVFKLEDAGKAFDYVMSRGSMGKVIVEP